MAQRESTQDGQIQFKELGGLNQRPSPSNLPYPEFGLLHGLYPPRDGWMQRLEGVAHITTAPDGVLNLYQADDGTGDLIVQTVDGSELRYTLDEIFGRGSPTVSLTPDPLEEEDSMSMALIVHEENQGTDGGSLNSNAGSEALNTFYNQKLTANPVNEDTIVTTFRDYLAGANPNTWDLAAGTYRFEGELQFAFNYTAIDSSLGTCTISNASPALVTLNAHNLAVNDAITFSTTGALPNPLVAGTTYFVSVVVSANTFRISATVGGANINTTTAGSGTHTCSGVTKNITATAALYDETNSAVLVTFMPGISETLITLTTAGSHPTLATVRQDTLSAIGSFTLSGAARLSVRAAVNSSSGTPFAQSSMCRGKSHGITTALGGGSLRNIYTRLKLIKET